ncbi:MAG TPA: VWA-like domain-containing protein [Ktedonobacterales bacterium]|nr:VWA-like domain-containing protein [Ktedonobacterales bacterium]
MAHSGGLLQPDELLDRQVSGALMRIRMRSPFFSTLALFARIRPTETLPTAATDGRDIYINPDYFSQLAAPERVGLLLHEVLHAALLHVPRRGARDPLLWNIAADVVVNGVIAKESGYALPEGGIREPELEELSVEEVYHALQSNGKYRRLTRVVIMRDVLAGGPGAGEQAGERANHTYAALAAHWGEAQAQASAVMRMAQHGSVPASLQRELGMLTQARLDWRAYLWRFLVRTPIDFQGFDRRFIGQGLYLEAFDGESISVHVAVDTSGSVEGRTLDSFLSEVRGILSAYPHIRCWLYYADAACYGPYALTADDPIPPPQGGGGTDFRPFFAAVAREAEATMLGETTLCIYLTDGYGEFPAQAPNFPTLWVLTPGGTGAEALPFGEGVRLIDED